jgi:cytochrome c556
MFKVTTITIALTMATTSVMAADTPRHRSALSPAADALATEMAPYFGLAQACRPYDGSNLNKSFWDGRISSAVPNSQLNLFSEVVRSRAQPTIQQLSGPDAPLKCDDALDRVEDQFPSLAEAGEAAEPICWSDVTDANRCEGTGEDDILAGVGPLLDGY